MLQDLFTLGDKIDIKPLDNNGRTPHNARTFVSQLVDIIDSDVISIASPIVYGKALVLNPGTCYTMSIYSNKGVYQCNSEVLSNKRDNNMFVTVVRITTRPEKVQRRQYYRLECVHDITYRLYTRDEQLLEQKLKENNFKNEEEYIKCKQELSKYESNWMKGTVIDISGGGARFSSKTLHHSGDIIRIDLEIKIGKEIKRLKLGAKMISSREIANRNNIYDHRIEFHDIKAKDRENLIRFIFEQDRRRRSNDMNR